MCTQTVCPCPSLGVTVLYPCMMTDQDPKAWQRAPRVRGVNSCCLCANFPLTRHPQEHSGPRYGKAGTRFVPALHRTLTCSTSLCLRTLVQNWLSNVPQNNIKPKQHDSWVNLYLLYKTAYTVKEGPVLTSVITSAVNWFVFSWHTLARVKSKIFWLELPP